MSDFFPSFRDYIAQHHPLFLEGAQALSPLLVSPEVVQVPATLERDIHALIEVLLAARKDPLYRSQIAAQVGLPSKLQSEEQTSLACFDFYWTPEGIRLIEVNTNAAAWVLVELLRGYHNLDIPKFSSLYQGFQREWTSQFPTKPFTHVAIVDETPAEQKTWFEFLWIQALLREQGLTCEILAPEDLRFDLQTRALVDAQGRAWPFVYNRFCDFLLETPSSQALRQAYEAGALCLRPSPHEYAYLSDKSRLVQWSSPAWQAGFSATSRRLLETMIPPVEVMDVSQIERFWTARKGLFFKPASSYGGKSVYSGKRISRSVFARLVEMKALAQPLFQPAVWTSKSGKSFKYDLRIYVRGDRVVSTAARLFQGQVSNFQTPGGGFAPVVFSFT